MPAEFTEPRVFLEDQVGVLASVSTRSASGIVKMCMLLALGVCILYLVGRNVLVLAGVLLVLRFALDWAVARWNPRYFRISPGRLEIIRYGALRTDPLSHETHSLRDAQVTCDYARRIVQIAAERNQTSALIDLRRTSRPHALVEAIFDAALCSRDAPALPTDQLSG